ncbi:hypothetical protein, partial [Rothia dentocariosa]
MSTVFVGCYNGNGEHQNPPTYRRNTERTHTPRRTPTFSGPGKTVRIKASTNLFTQDIPTSHT